MKVGTDAVLLPCLTDFSQANHILEVGCGSGVISLMSAQLSQAQIHAIDIHLQSVNQAQQNFKESPWSNRLTVQNISFQEFAQSCTQEYDLIISNPPFFIDSLKSPIENRNLARHNDHLTHSELLNSARQLLKPNGTLSVILPQNEGVEFTKKALKDGFYLKSRTEIKPKPSKSANRVVIELCLVQQDNHVKQLIIREENNEYTQAYKELTKDFYLAL